MSFGPTSFKGAKRSTNGATTITPAAKRTTESPAWLLTCNFGQPSVGPAPLREKLALQEPTAALIAVVAASVKLTGTPATSRRASRRCLSFSDSLLYVQSESASASLFAGASSQADSLLISPAQTAN